MLGEPGMQHLAGIVPLVERRVDVEPFVALQANQIGAEQLCHHLRELGFPAAGLALDEQRLAHLSREEHGGRNGLVGHVAKVLHRTLHGLNVGIHGGLPDDGGGVAFGSSQKTVPAAGAAEVVRAARVLGAMARRRDCDGHAAHRIALV